MDHNSLRKRIASTRSILGKARGALLAPLMTTFAFAQVPEPNAPSDSAGGRSDAATDEASAIQPAESQSERSPAEEGSRTTVIEDDRPQEESSQEQPALGSSETGGSEEEDEGGPNGEQLPPRQSLIPEIHGFVSQGFLKTSQHNYLARSERGSFEFTEVGLNFTKQVSERLRIGMQLFMRDLGPIGNYRPQFDWFYLDYNFFDWLGLRAGRTKIPFGLYNEINDTDSARVPILLPQSVYPIENRDYLLAQTGLELYGRIPLLAAGALEYRTYGGTIFFAEDSAEVERLDVPYVVGGRLMWETPLDGLRAGGTLQALSLDGDYVPAPGTLQGLQDAGLLDADESSVPFHIPAVLWVTSLEYAVHHFHFAAEYSRWHVRIRSDYPAIIPPSETTHERFYVMASHRVASWFTPGAYYSVYFPDVDERNAGRERRWHDLAVTMRFDLTDNWLFKLEGHYMEGTAGLESDLNDNIPLADLSSNWGLLLAKTTAYF